MTSKGTGIDSGDKPTESTPRNAAAAAKSKSQTNSCKMVQNSHSRFLLFFVLHSPPSGGQMQKIEEGGGGVLAAVWSSMVSKRDALKFEIEFVAAHAVGETAKSRNGTKKLQNR